MNEKKINKHVHVWVLNFLVGHFGVDRFVRGQIGMGIFKFLCNWMTVGIWGLVDFIIALVKAYGTYSDTQDFTFINGKYSK
jgi:Predicted membrane protein